MGALIPPAPRGPERGGKEATPATTQAPVANFTGPYRGNVGISWRLRRAPANTPGSGRAGRRNRLVVFYAIRAGRFSGSWMGAQRIRWGRVASHPPSRRTEAETHAPGNTEHYPSGASAVPVLLGIYPNGGRLCSRCVSDPSRERRYQQSRPGAVRPRLLFKSLR